MDIRSLEAKKLREAFKNIPDEQGGESILGDYVEVKGRLSGGPKDPCWIVIQKDGRDIASIPVTNGTFKRLKSEFGWWKAIHARSLSRANS